MIIPTESCFLAHPLEQHQHITTRVLQRYMCVCITAQVLFGKWSRRIAGSRSITRTSACWRKPTRISWVGSPPAAGSDWRTWRWEVNMHLKHAHLPKKIHTQFEFQLSTELRGKLWCHWLSGEPQRGHHDDASAVFLPSEEELPVWYPSGVQAVGASAQPESSAALAAGKHSHTTMDTHLSRNTHSCMTGIILCPGGQSASRCHLPHRLQSSSSSKVHRSGHRWSLFINFFIALIKLLI